MELRLRYGLNPQQQDAYLRWEGDNCPLRVLNGAPGYINLLDAFNAWQLVKELKEATGRPGAASFKHVSPAGAAIAGALSESFRRSQMITADDLSPVATAYARARGGDRMCSFGDFVAVSDTVDRSLANLLRREVSDGIIAPGYDADALAILKEKKQGRYLILQMDPAYEPAEMESRQVYGFSLSQQRNLANVDPHALGTFVSQRHDLPEDIALTLTVATIALKYTQSNSVCVAYDGQVIGMGAGQQSRMHCTRLACSKADKWFCQQHPGVVDLPFREGLSKVEKANVVDRYLLWDELSDAERDALLATLTTPPVPLTRDEKREWIQQFSGVVLSSDAYLPFRDNIDRAHLSGVQYVLQAGGSIRDEEVTAAVDEYDMVMLHSGMRWFQH